MPHLCGSTSSVSTATLTSTALALAAALLPSEQHGCVRSHLWSGVHSDPLLLAVELLRDLCKPLR